MTTPSPAINNRVEELWHDHASLVDYLQAKRQLQLLSRVHDSFRKTLIIAAASYFEVQFTEIIVGLYDEADRGTGILSEFVRRKAIGRSFSSLFAWDSSNANYFYNLFGPKFAESMKKRVQHDGGLADSVNAFLEIGYLRNELVHKNYADFQLNKTLEEIYECYQKATHFLTTFPTVVGEFVAANNSDGNQ